MSWRPGQWLHLPRWQGGEDVPALRRQIAALVEEVGELARRARTPSLQSCAAGIAAWDGTETSAELVWRADAELLKRKRANVQRALQAF
jgi:hypothetical protein